jgi:hypothetical protein
VDKNKEVLPIASAQPSKSFFIDMLTKDIALSVCILDLMDNSIHSLIADSDLDVSEHLIGRVARHFSFYSIVSYAL